MSLKPATIKEIARLLDISASTVSRALHDHASISLTTREKVKKLAKELNYEPNQTAVFFPKRENLHHWRYFTRTIRTFFFLCNQCY